MKQLPLIFLFLAFGISSYAQPQPKTIDELINYSDPGWKKVKKWIDSAVNKVEILAVDTAQAREALLDLQESTETPLGTIMYMTGGLLVDEGWIRILGSGSNKLTRSVTAWNKGKTYNTISEKSHYLLVADDALGGFFAINEGGLGSDKGKIYYLVPATLEWKRMDMNYEEFLHFVFNEDLDEFYVPFRTKNWRNDVSGLGADKCYNYSPPLWAKEGKNFTKSVRRYIPAEEQFNYNMVMRKKLGMESE